MTRALAVLALILTGCSSTQFGDTFCNGIKPDKYSPLRDSTVLSKSGANYLYIAPVFDPGQGPIIRNAAGAEVGQCDVVPDGTYTETTNGGTLQCTFAVSGNNVTKSPNCN